MAVMNPFVAPSVRRARRVAALLALAALAMAACTPRGDIGVVPTTGASSDATPAGPRVVIGTSPLAESRLLGATMAELLTIGGFTPTIDERADSAILRDALEVGDVDAAPGYSGRAWLEVLQRPDPPGDPRTSFARVREADLTDGIVWLSPRFDLEAGADGPPADSTFGLFVRGVPSADADLTSVAQLALRLGERPDAEVCLDQQFADRPDGWSAVAQAYAIGERTLTLAVPEQALALVAEGSCLVGLASATDGRAWGAGLALLNEPLDVFPAFVVTAQVRASTLERLPGVREALTPLPAQLTTRLLGEANAAVVAGASIEEVARELARGLLQRDGREVPELPELPEVTEAPTTPVTTPASS